MDPVSDYLDEDLYLSGRYIERIPDSHLQSPIRDVYRRMIYNHPSKWPAFISNCLSRCPVPLHLLCINSEEKYGILLGTIYDLSQDDKMQWVYSNYPECSYVVTEFLAVICKELGLGTISTRVEPTEKDMLLISQKVLWDDIRTCMQEKRLTEDFWTEITQLPHSVIEMKVCSQLLILKTFDTPDQWYVLDYDQVMMISDTIAGRVFTIIYNDILPKDIPGKIPIGLLERIYRIYDQLLTLSGNEAYISIAKWEAICMATILKKYDRLQRSTSYYTWLLDSLTASQDDKGLEMLALLINSNLSVESLAELHGIYRHWGHPTVNEELGCEKVKNIATNRPIPSSKVLLQMTGALKRQFVSSFVSKHGRWPRVDNKDCLKGKPIHKLIVTQSTILNFYSPEYPLDDWGLIRFGKEFEFDYHPDYTDLLEDRSISVSRSEVRSLYNSDALGYRPPKIKTDRRVLKEALKRPTINVGEICSRVQRDAIPEEWKIIIVHAKEREMKIAPRLFAMMTFEMRLYFSVTEANIKDKIFPYFPQQTMTLDESDLSKRLLSLTSSIDSFIKMLSALLGIDFSSWNICWTYLSTYFVFQFMDDLFGTPGLFVQTHKFFEDSLIALASHHNPPSSLIKCPKGQPEECNELWYNHRGGFEGLRQKGWTLCTIGLLLLVEANTGLKSYVIGQGDNQVCKLMIPIPDDFDSVESYVYSDQEEISRKVDKFIKTLETYAQKIGLHVKMDETWVGMDILAYGKEILYQGAFMPQGLKRISRLLTDVNEIYPTLHTKISTLQTSGMACSQKSYDICTPYYLSTVEVLMTILRDIHRMYQSKILNQKLYETSKTISFKEFLLSLSSDIGSCPILSFISFLYRGHPDPLTTYTTYLRVLGTSKTIPAKLYTWLSNRCYPLGRGDCELLVSNPCSVNIESPETMSTRMRRDLESALISYTKNQDLKEIFNTATKERDASLFKFLISARPCHPRVAHEIFRNTITGTKLSFLSKFSNTRTTQTLFSESKTNEGMMKTVRYLEKELILYWFSMYTSVKSVPLDLPIENCPTKLAQQIRDDSWSGALEGSRIEGVTIPHPFHQFSPFFSSKPEEHSNIPDPHIRYMIPSNVESSLVSRRGPYSAYVGSTTREKRTGRMYTIPQASRPLKSAERLIQLRDWVSRKGGYLYDFLTSASQSRTNIPTQILEDTTSPIIGGSVTHRLDDHVTKRGTLHNFRPNITTHAYFSTDPMGRFSQGATNFNMHFQGAIHLGVSSLQLGIVHSAGPHHKYCSLIYTRDCCEEVLEDFVMDSPLPFTITSVSETNPLLYAKVGYIPKTFSPSDISIVRFIRSNRPAEAIGFVLFTRCLSTGQSYHLGITEKTNPLIGTVGVAEILGAGLYNVLFHLAKYIYFYLPRDQLSIQEFFYMMHSSSLNDIAAICLLPSILPELCSLMGFATLPEMFCSKDVVANLLKRTLEALFSDFVRNSKRIEYEAYNTIYYPSATLGIRRVLRMWSNQIITITHGEINVTSILDQLEDYVPPSDYIPNAQFVQEMVKSLLSSADTGYLEDICSICPLKMSQLPAQAVARDARKHQKMPSFTRNSASRELKSQAVKISGYTQPYTFCIDCPVLDTTPEITPVTRIKRATFRVDKSRVDQSYRIFGVISTAFLKILEILIIENIVISKDVVTLAEGEGSIADLLVRYGARHVYYNTLVNRSKLVEQRAPGYVPSCLAYDPARVKMGGLTAMTGGDLCDPEVLRSILSFVPNKDIDIVTCDAESSGNLTPDIANKILLAWMAVCKRTRSVRGIFKTFCHNADIITNVASSANLIYKDVRVVVPCYSSHETYEAYVVCHNFSPSVDIQTITHAHKEGVLLKSMGSEGLQVSFQKFKRDRISDHPLQDLRIDLVLRMWKWCSNEGIQDNAISNIQRLTMFNVPYSNHVFHEWLNEVMEVTRERALRSIAIQSASYFGLSTEFLHPIYMPKHHILHTQVEAHMTCMINASVLKSIIGVSRADIIPTVETIISATHELRDENKIIYKYSVDMPTWKKAYLKSVCRVWGHWRFQRNHKCEIIWQ